MNSCYSLSSASTCYHLRLLPEQSFQRGWLSQNVIRRRTFGVLLAYFRRTSHLITSKEEFSDLSAANTMALTGIIRLLCHNLSKAKDLDQFGPCLPRSPDNFDSVCCVIFNPLAVSFIENAA
jgi:hypothetical protein